MVFAAVNAPLKDSEGPAPPAAPPRRMRHFRHRDLPRGWTSALRVKSRYPSGWAGGPYEPFQSVDLTRLPVGGPPMNLTSQSNLLSSLYRFHHVVYFPCGAPPPPPVGLLLLFRDHFVSPSLFPLCSLVNFLVSSSPFVIATSAFCFPLAFPLPGSWPPIWCLSWLFGKLVSAAVLPRRGQLPLGGGSC